MEAKYRPQIFNVKNETDAKNIILTPDGGTSTEERWEKETPFLVEDICSFIKPNEDTLILDFGSGLGRVSKGLIEAANCKVLGLDISASMRFLSMNYVNSENFSSVSTELLKNMVGSGLKVDACVSLWVLQHCPHLENEISLIKSVLKDGGCFYILNTFDSVIPTDKGWLNDGKNIKQELAKSFNLVSESKLPESCTNETISKISFIAKYVKN